MAAVVVVVVGNMTSPDYYVDAIRENGAKLGGSCIFVCYCWADARAL